MYRLALLLGVVASACGGSDSGSFKSVASPGGQASDHGIVGTSIEDAWGLFETLGASGPVLFRFDGTEWSRVDIVLDGAPVTPSSVASAGVGHVFVFGDTARNGVVVRVDALGNVEDHTAEFPVILTGQGGGTHLVGGHGGALVRLMTGETFSLGAGGTFASIAEPPGSATDAQPIGVVGPDDGYFVKSVVPSEVRHFHTGAYDAVGVDNLAAFFVIGSGPTDVWLPVQAGASGAHGDGTTFTSYTIGGIPSSAEPGALFSTGAGTVGLLAKDGNDAVFLHLDDQLQVSSTELLATDLCDDELACQPLLQSDAGQLEDGSVMFRASETASAGTIYFGRVDD